MRFLIAALALTGGALASTPAEKASATLLIRTFGFNCPLVVALVDYSADHHGRVQRAYCGPPEAKSLSETIAFRITWRPNGKPTVAPWP